MALEVTNLERTFKFKKNGKEIILQDPGPLLSPREVMKFYAGAHPELTNGEVEGPTVVGDKANYNLTTKAGQLG